jgi:hypothetical protein
MVVNTLLLHLTWMRGISLQLGLFLPDSLLSSELSLVNSSHVLPQVAFGLEASAAFGALARPLVGMNKPEHKKDYRLYDL